MQQESAMQMLFTRLREVLGDAVGQWVLFFQTSSLNAALGSPAGADRFITALASRPGGMSQEHQDEVRAAFAALPLPAAFAPADSSSWTLSSSRIDLGLYNCLAHAWLLRRTEADHLKSSRVAAADAYTRRWYDYVEVSLPACDGSWREHQHNLELCSNPARALSVLW